MYRLYYRELFYRVVKNCDLRPVWLQRSKVYKTKRAFKLYDEYKKSARYKDISLYEATWKEIKR